MTADTDYSPCWLPVGTRVTDEQADDDPTAVILTHRGVRADDHEWRDGTTVAATNPTYPPHAEVVTVAFESTLDAHAPRWRAIVDDTDPAARAQSLANYLRLLAVDWDVTITTYDYPWPRLVPVAAADEFATRDPDGDRDRLTGDTHASAADGPVADPEPEVDEP